MRRPRSERIPHGQAGIWHIVSRCVRSSRLLEGAGSREWLSAAFASWLDVLAVDLLGYALMGNHVHVIVRTRPDVAAGWTPGEVRRRLVASAAVSDGRPGLPSEAPVGSRLSADELMDARALLSHPGAMLRAVKEGFARRLNRSEGTAGHVWESRYQDIALLDAGGVLACLVYVDLNPFRAGLVKDPKQSQFCSARHRLAVDKKAPDAVLALRLTVLNGHPLLLGDGSPAGSWAWTSGEVAELTDATARMIRTGSGRLPSWANELLPRLGVAHEHWSERMSRPGMLASGNVLAAHRTRAALATGRMPSDKSGLFGRV